MRRPLRIGAAAGAIVACGAVGASIAGAIGPVQSGPPIPGEGVVSLSTQASVSSDRRATLTATCTVPIGTACTGHVTLSAIMKVPVTRHGRTTRTPKLVTFAQAPYDIAPGPGTISIRLSTLAYDLLHRARGRQVSVNSTVDSTAGYMAITRLRLIAQG